MEQLIEQVRAYAEARGIKPATVLQYAAGLSGRTWSRWLDGGQCNLATASEIREYMASNPPVKRDGSLACDANISPNRDIYKGAAE